MRSSVRRLPILIGACARVIGAGARRVGQVVDRIDLGRGRAVVLVRFGRRRSEAYSPREVEAVPCPSRITRKRDATPRVIPWGRKRRS